MVFKLSIACTFASHICLSQLFTGHGNVVLSCSYALTIMWIVWFDYQWLIHLCLTSIYSSYLQVTVVRCHRYVFLQMVLVSYLVLVTTLFAFGTLWRVHVKLQWKVCSHVCLHDMLICIMSSDDFLWLRCLYTEVLLVNIRTMMYCVCCTICCWCMNTVVGVW